MTLVSLPDIFAMLILMGVLGWLMRRHPGQRVELWLAGLSLVLVEAIAVSVGRGSPGLQRNMHVIALDAYVLAGATFSFAARATVWPRRASVPFFLIPAVPMLVLSTLYGYEVRAVAPYLWISVVSFAGGLIYLARAWRRRPRVLAGMAAMHAWIWLPMISLAGKENFRGLVYWGLCCLYLLAGISFRRTLYRGRIGGVAIVSGFVIWAACFGLHPLLHGNAVYAPVLGQVWSLQKFFVTMGMLLVLLEDQTERSKEQALKDPLTGLPNRRLFDDRLVHALERSRRFHAQLGLFIIDLNGFKGVNDFCGHSTGDRVLQQTAYQLKARIRGSDTLARLGGDEFCVIMSDVNEVDCARIAQSLREAVTRVMLPAEFPGTLSASIGYALYPGDAGDPDALRNLADARMYDEKRATTPASMELGRQYDASETYSGGR